MKSVDEYIRDEPHAVEVKELFGKAITELASPAPAVKLAQFEKFTKMTGGFREKEFSILCGATGSGKTSVLSCFSADLLTQGIPHFVASVETGPTDFVKRVISVLEKKDWNHGEAIPVEQLRRFADQRAKLFHGPLWMSLYEDRFSVETLMSDIAYMVKHHGIKIAFIDNLNFFLEVTKAQDTIVEMDRVIHELIIFTKNVPVHIVMVMHPKKTENGRIDSELDIKGSSTAVQEAYNVFLWNRVHPKLLANALPGLDGKPSITEMDRELMIAKMRRKGKFVRKRLIFKCSDCVSYSEGDIYGHELHQGR